MTVLREGGSDYGSVLKTARLRSESHVQLEDPFSFIQELKQSGLRADIFTFVRHVNNRIPRHAFYQQAEKIAVLPITTYDEWFTKRLHNKPRNMIRKALKSGIEIRLEEFSDPLLQGIKAIYDETPIRQGKRNWHYSEDLETIRREHGTFLDRSQFIAVLFWRRDDRLCEVDVLSGIRRLHEFPLESQPPQTRRSITRFREGGGDLCRTKAEVPCLRRVGAAAAPRVR